MSSIHDSVRKCELTPKTNKAVRALKLTKMTIVTVSEFSHGFLFIAYSFLSLFAYSQDGSTGSNCERKFQIEEKT